jgi:hypothetical protein
MTRATHVNMINFRLALLRLGMSMTPATMPMMNPPMEWKGQQHT